MKIKDLLERNASLDTQEQIAEEGKIPLAETQSSKTALELFREEVRVWLSGNRSDPICVVQRHAIDLFKDRAMKLKKQVHYGGLFWKIGSPGFTLESGAIEMLPEKAKEMLERQMQKPNVRLCSLGEYIYTLPMDYFRLVKKEDTNQMSF